MSGILDKLKKWGINLLLEKFMEGTFKFLTDFFGPLTKTKWGTKAIVAILAIGTIGGLAYIDKITDDWAIATGITIIFVVYCIFRQKQESNGESQ